MNKIININLGGRSYSVEEPGYNLLREYLDNAAKNLEGNPDKEEILKDFNQAIAEKCDNYLSSTKNVITTSEVETILKEMGPVENGSNEGGSDKGADAKSGNSNHKKLYLIEDGAVISGVCNGLAAYFDMDVTLIRVVFIGLTILTHGAWILVYFIMAMVVPKANTPEEKAEAFGTIRMTAQDLMQRARKGYDTFKNSNKDSKHWKKWKEQTKEEKRKWKYEQRNYHYTYKQPTPFYELMHNILGLIWFAFFVYIAWYGYNTLPSIHHLFDSIGMATEHIAGQISAWAAKK